MSGGIANWERTGWKCLEACQNGETKVVQEILLESCKEESGLNNKDERGCTVFMIACEEGHEDVVQLFLHYLDPSIEL